MKKFYIEIKMTKLWHDMVEASCQEEALKIAKDQGELDHADQVEWETTIAREGE